MQNANTHTHRTEREFTTDQQQQNIRVVVYATTSDAFEETRETNV